MPRRPPPPRLEGVDPTNLVSAGGPVDTVSVSLRVFGDDLDPSEVTTLLSATPARSARKGDELPGRYHRIAPTGSWILQHDAADTDGAPLEAAIMQLLSSCSDDLEVWRSLTQRFTVDIFCGLFMEEFNRGFDLSAELLERLSARKLRLAFDLYATGAA